jgi:1-acyl-sn-glycerol-3-phosphate acyltransferase
MHFLGWPIDFLIFKIFTNFRVIGKENLKEVRRSVIFIGNHESYFDPYIIGASIPWFSKLHPVYYLAQDRLFKKKLLKFCLWLFGAFPGRVGEGIEKAMEKPLELLKKKKTVGIFPEWCYDCEPEASRIREVISKLSINTGTPVIPVFIFGIYDGGISWWKILNRKREVRVIFGKPIYSNSSSPEEMEKLVGQAHLRTKLSLIKSFHEEEKKFWNHYAKFYYYLERAQPYKDLIRDFNKNLPEKIKGKWLDLGSGSGAITELLVQKAGSAQITATDIEQRMLDFLSNRFNENKNINIKQLDLAYSFTFPDNSFDGITANLVLPYLIHHEGEIGLKGFIGLLKCVYRVLKPGGHFIFSSPRENVNFLWVFLASWKNIFDPKNLNHIYYGPAIFKQALQIQRKGKCGIYHFLNIKDLEKILTDIGFKNINFSRSMAEQADIVSCRK